MMAYMEHSCQMHSQTPSAVACPTRQGGREGGRQGGRVEWREGGWDGGREGGKDACNA